jgi:hypothetical protein
MQRFFDAVIRQHDKAFEAIEEAKARARAKAEALASAQTKPAPASSQVPKTRPAAVEKKPAPPRSPFAATSAHKPDAASGHISKLKVLKAAATPWPNADDGLAGLEVRELGPMSADTVMDSSAFGSGFSSGFGSAFDLDANGSADAVWMGAHEVNEAGYLPEAALLDAQDERLQLLSGPGDWQEADLAIGAWVEIKLKGNWVRAQMTWASPHRTLFMFISGAGLAHSMSRRTMDRLRKAGLMRVVATHRVMDNALDAVAQVALRNNRRQG